ncbi:hypothetical protein [uncultured Tessaracoccus sp.]|uniref:hypothetical protein n=1 Tax=uncultured Tessaracoccus sp. TaxID=905023 RepID=UPI00260FC11C|nr:hypothetical protein [uncultured Tessaracoccus sp.]
MVVVIVLAAFAVMALAALAGTGKFGEWAEPVNDRQKGRLPDGRITAENVDDVRIPGAMFGYDRAEVDEYVSLVTSGVIVADPVEFTIRQRGYDMQFVDELISRLGAGEPIAASVPAHFGPDGRMSSSSVQE